MPHPAPSAPTIVLTGVRSRGRIHCFRMNSMPRILGLGLLVVLASLAALLGASAWNDQRAGIKPAPPSSVAVANPDNPPGSPPSARLSAITNRMALALALTAFALAVMLVFSLTLRLPGRVDTRQPFIAARSEITTLA